jgi:phosphatidylinositol alpha-1,6-mannosyltransferase
MEPAQALLKRYGVPFTNCILFAGRMTLRKGLSRFIEKSLPAVLEAVPDAGVVVVGDNPDQSLNKLGEQRAVVDTVQRLGLQDKVRMLGQVSDAELLAWYAAADVLVFPLIEVPGDVEGFGMVAVEAAACGTPTIAFRAGGVPDAVGQANGRLVDAGRYDMFSSALVATLAGDRPSEQQCIEHARKFSWENFHRDIQTLLQKLY